MHFFYCKNVNAHMPAYGPESIVDYKIDLLSLGKHYKYTNYLKHKNINSQCRETAASLETWKI